MAVTIALAAGGGFTLTVPSTIEGRSHTVNVPGDESGIKIIRKVLLARQKEVRKEIGFDASPTQHLVEAWLRKDRAERTEAAKRAAAEKEAKLAAEAKKVLGGIDLGALDL